MLHFPKEKQAFTGLDHILNHLLIGWKRPIIFFLSRAEFKGGPHWLISTVTSL